jgi:hypothetical protein
VIEFSNEEKIAIISKAIKENRIAYAAYFTLGEDASLVGEIKWHKLN